MAIANYLTFHEFIKQSYPETEYQLLLSTHKLLKESTYNAISVDNITSEAGLPEARLYRFYPEGKPAVVKTLLNALLHYCKQTLFHPLQKNHQDTKKALTAFIEIIDRLEHSDEIEFLYFRFIKEAEFTQQTQAYYRLWEQLVSGLLYEEHDEKIDLGLVQYSFALIHTTLMVKMYWGKQSTREYLLKNLAHLWQDVIGNAATILIE